MSYSWGKNHQIQVLVYTFSPTSSTINLKELYHNESQAPLELRTMSNKGIAFTAARKCSEP